MSKQMKQLFAVVLLTFAIVLIMTAIGKTTYKDFDDTALRAKYLEEFDNAYDKEITPSGVVREINMVASESEIEIFDGYKTKVWAYNGQVPGPEIRIKLGDTLKINFQNKLPQETTIHFHGVRVPNAMDGVPGVTQDPIKPGESFVYEFTPKDAGTFWFHPHIRSSEQIERGLYGILVVEEKEDLFDVDKTLVIDDWRLDKNKQIFSRFDTPMDIMHDGRWGNVITVNGKLDASIIAQPGSVVRLRLINTSNARIYRPKIKGVDAKVIAIDGMNVKESFAFGELDLAPGNRIDIAFKIPENQKEDIFIYDVFANARNDLFTIKVSGPVKTDSRLQYKLNKDIPDWSNAYKLSVDKVYELDLRRKPGGSMMDLEWTINGKAYPEYTPFTFEYAKMNVFQFVNKTSRFHPMHLHGQFFKVISRNGKPVTYPYFQDTVLVYPGETVTLATVPLDKGKWVNHCHILEHAEAGMMTVVEVE